MEKLIPEEKTQTKWWALWGFLVICVIVIGVCVGAIYYFYLLPHIRSGTSEEGEICLTNICLEATVEIMSSLDAKQDPCVDFYQFTCGNFIAEAKRKTNLSPYVAEMKRNKNRFISEPIRGDEQTPILLQKRLYQSCMDVTSIDEDENETFNELLEEIGGWPIPKGQDWAEEEVNLEELLVQCKNLGLSFQWFFEIKYDGHLGGLSVNYPKLTTPYHDPFLEYVYKNVIVETAVTLGASRMLAENEMEKILNFEKELAAIVFKNKRGIISFMDVTELDGAFPRFSWLRFLNNLTAEANYTVAENDTIATAETYLRELNLLLAKTPTRVQVNYIIWKIIQDFGNYLSNPLRDNFDNFTINLMDSKDYEINNRFEICIKEATTRFPRTFEHKFMSWYSSEQKSEKIIKIITDMKGQFISRLESADWIDTETKEVAISDVKNIVDNLESRKLDIDEGVLEKFLNIQDLEFTSDNVIDMIREKNVYDFQLQFVLADLFVNFDMDATRATDLVAETTRNNLYSEHRPNFLNYGALGGNVGRQIAHHFITTALFQDLDAEREIISTWSDDNDEIHNVTLSNATQLWRNESIWALMERTECINNDYETIISVINDEETLAEHFAHLIGVDTAYNAYLKWVEENGEEPKLIGLPFTPAQLFWIQYGTMNCFQEIDESDWTFTEYNHALLRSKVITSLRNSEHFSKDFDCPFDAPMNPIFKCQVF